ncbi:hypothetical protein P154DRAFT_582050 [Amniculicola lignicola CBS 123094]|uniref:Uncharacterized protein n=1 Tax=Amniculicola lignicola CBS 123094 TaxID=1392246 RepID=A0A6A5VXT8_9PLEO|nr:hypothetical protein P154DRAFT_582050 [Amniculicola lignicola CBS 123094]
MYEALPGQLAELVLIRLSRELRDIIYVYLWDAEAVNTINSALPALLRGDYDGILRSNIGPLVKMMANNKPFGAEMVQTLYESKTDRLWVCQFEVGPFLKTDLFGQGVAPRNVKLKTLGIRSIVPPNMAHCMVPYRKHLRNALEEVLHLKLWPGFHLHIEFEWLGYVSNKNDFIPLLKQSPSLRSAFRRLRDRGAEITAVIDVPSNMSDTPIKGTYFYMELPSREF